MKSKALKRAVIIVLAFAMLVSTATDSVTMPHTDESNRSSVTILAVIAVVPAAMLIFARLITEHFSRKEDRSR